MNLKQQIDEARQAFYAARERPEDLEEEYRKTVEEPQMRKLIGKCFKYLNRHSEGESWWLYARVFDFRDGQLCIVLIEKDCQGEYEVREILLNSLSGNYIPITDAEYRAAVEPILATIKERAGL